MSRKIHLGINDISHNASDIKIGVPKEKIKNIIKNGSLSETTLNWTLDNNYYTFTQEKGYLHLEATQTATGTRPNYQYFNKVVGSLDENENQILYACAMVRGYETNTSYPRVYLSRHLNGSETQDFGPNLSPHNSSVNNGWYLVSARFQTYQSSTQYYDYDRIAFGISTTTTGDKMDICNVMLFNLTETFGRGQEPTKAQCDEYLSWKFFNNLNNGKLNLNADGWTTENADVTNDDECTKLIAISTNRPKMYQSFNPVTNQKMFACVKVKGKSTNTSYPILSIGGTAETYIYSSVDGKQKLQLNDGEWHFMRMYLNVEASRTYSNINLCSTYEAGYSASVGDEYCFKDAAVYNLTEIFGSGYEPNDDWCIANLQNPRFNINVYKKQFSTNVAPNSWVQSQDNMSCTGTNELGNWKVISDTAYENLSTLFNEVYTASIHVGTRVNKKIILECPVRIIPQGFFVKQEAPRTERIDISAYDAHTNSWVQLDRLDTTNDDLINKHYQVDTNSAYDKYCLNILPEGSGVTYGCDIYAFELRVGNIIDECEYINIDASIQKSVACKVVNVFIGNNNFAKKTFSNRIKYFFTGILPIDFQLTDGYYKAQAVDEYGIWKIESSNTELDADNNITNMCDGNYQNKITQAYGKDCYYTISLPNTTYIKPTQFCLIYSIGTNTSSFSFTIQGYTENGSWEDVANVPLKFGQLNTRHYSYIDVDTDKYYSKFRLHVVTGSGYSPAGTIYDFQIKEGYIKY